MHKQPLFLSFLSMLFFVGLALPAARNQLLPGDEPVYVAIQAQRSPRLDAFFRTITRVGDRSVLAPVTMGMVFWQIKNWRLALFLIPYSWGMLPVGVWAKSAIARSRPYNSLVSGPLPHASYGFPSGHALASAALYGLLIVLLHRKRPFRGWQQGITGGIFLLILLVGFSRVYLGVHWPSDVLAGYALGGAYCSLAMAVYGWIEKRSGNQQVQE